MTPSSPPAPSQTTRKRTRAPSLSSNIDTPRPRKGRRSGPDALFEVAESIRAVATSVLVSEKDSSDHVRRAAAIETVEADGSLTRSECIKVMKLFRRDIDIADAYLAIKDSELRTAFILSELEDAM
jgi:hypothetical protein